MPSLCFTAFDSSSWCIARALNNTKGLFKDSNAKRAPIRCFTGGGCGDLLHHSFLIMVLIKHHMMFFLFVLVPNDFAKNALSWKHVLRYCFRLASFKKAHLIVCFWCPCLPCFNASLINDPYHLPALFITLRDAISIPGVELFSLVMVSCSTSMKALKVGHNWDA